MATERDTRIPHDLSGGSLGNTDPKWIIDQYGNARFDGSVRIEGDLTCDDITIDDITIDSLTCVTLTVTGNATVGGTLGVTGAITGSSTIQGTVVTGTTSVVAPLGAFGTTPATTGTIRIPNNAGIFGRNAANDDDATLLSWTTSNVIQLGASSVNAGVDIEATTASSIVLNNAGSDVDVRVESDTNANHFVSDAGIFSGVGGFGFGSTNAGNNAYLSVDSPALSIPTNQPFARTWLFSSNAVTVPSGTAATFATLAIREPNITATGTVSDAYTVYINDAPTEGTRNGALWVASGAARFDGRVAEANGADVASANTLTLGNDGNTFNITGNTQINLITTTGWAVGNWVTLCFKGGPITVANNQAPGATTAAIVMGSNGSYVADTNYVATFVLTSNGASPVWRFAGGTRG